MKTPRDSQRQKVYDAERIAFEHHHHAAFVLTGEALDLDHCQSLVDVVCGSEHLREKYGFTKDAPKVVAGHGNRERGCYRHGKNEIHLPEWTRQKWYVLHEVAHALVPPTRERQSHGREWAACYVELVRAYLGRGAYDALTSAFGQKRVAWKPKRAYTINDAERARRAERARALRSV